MHWTLFALAGLALLAGHSLKLPAAGARFGALIAFIGGLLVSAIMIKGLASAAGLGRTTAFDQFVNGAVVEARQDPAPLIVFSGASFSRSGIDPARLTPALKQRGYNYRVVSLSIHAATVLERDDHLDQFMTLSGRTPDIVFSEVSEEFDIRAAAIFGNTKYSARAIEQFDIPATAWTAYGILGGACEWPTGCLKDTIFLGIHATLNGLNVGLISKGERPQDLLPRPSYHPRHDARQPTDPTQAAIILDQPPVSGPNWARAYRDHQRARLTRKGVKTVAYFQPPMIDPALRAYASSLCRGELANYVCIHPDDPALMSQLTGPVWVDIDHLKDSGTAIYDAWLIDQLIASGLLEQTR